MGGRKKRLNRLITRWIKSDLPEETSTQTVLLLGVTKLPTSPPARRPRSFPLLPRPFHRHGDDLSSARPPTHHQHEVEHHLHQHLKRATTTIGIMERSVDSIGNCSLDADTSVDLVPGKPCENPSVDTIYSKEEEEVDVATGEHHLPSYLSLACTVNGYSPSTNYDSVRYAQHHQHYSSLLSPPNLVPLPSMETKHSKKITFNPTDAVDACNNNTTHLVTCLNGDKDIPEESPMSLIQQRVERLYGPGAMAQGFLVWKRQKDEKTPPKCSDKKSNLNREIIDNGVVRQSVSTSSLPVLRHLTPEFCAQLPTFSSPRRNHPEAAMQKSSTLPQLSNTNDTTEAVTLTPNVITKSDGVVGAKDGNHFLKILESETQRLLALATKAEKELELNEAQLPENAKGYLRSAAGKARLLVSQKMQQFRGLCTNNLHQVEGEAFPTTNEDLQGFWDMVMLQVDQIDCLFAELDTMRANGWQEIVKKPIETKSRRNLLMNSNSNSPRMKSAAAEEAQAKRDAFRKQMRAMREAAKKNTTRNGEAIEIFASPHNASS